jgi:hypothetical protein
MARTIRVHRIDVHDQAGSGPVECTVHVTVTDDDPTAVALKTNTFGDVRRALLTRAAFNNLVGALKRPSGDDWPDGVLAHPVAKDP